MATIPIPTRLTEDELQAIDHLIERGVAPSRSGVIRTALELLIDADRRAAIGEQINEGYRRLPQTNEEIEWAERNALAMTEAEPW